MKYFALVIALLLIPFVAAETKVYFNDTFDTDLGWSGGTYDGTNKWYDTTSSWGTWTSPDVDISNFTWVRTCMNVYLESNHQFNKYYIGETTGTTSDPHLLIDSGWVSRPEPGYSPSYSGSYGSFQSICIEMNETSDKLEFFYGGTSRWSYTGTAFDWSAEDYIRIAVGDLNGGTEYRIDDVTIEALCDELPAGACSTPSTCTYSGSGNWIIQKSDNCTITTNTDIMNNTLFFNGSGSVGYTIINAQITNVSRIDYSDVPKVYLWWRGLIKKLT